MLINILKRRGGEESVRESGKFKYYSNCSYFNLDSLTPERSNNYFNLFCQ